MTRSGELRDGIERGFKLLLTPKSVVFIAGPVTGGMALIKHITETGNPPVGAIPSNVARMAKVKKSITSKSAHHTIINPGELYIPGWWAKDYQMFWSHILHNYVSKVVVLPDWKYSAGCIEQVTLARKLKLPITLSSGGPLTSDALSKARALAYKKYDTTSDLVMFNHYLSLVMAWDLYPHWEI